MTDLLLHRRALLGAAAALATAGTARAAPLLSIAGRYTPLTADIVHFFANGQSLSNGYHGYPLLSINQPTDNLMIGASVRPVDDSYKPQPSTSWVPQGPANADGTYPFNPLIATNQNGSGETPSEGAINFLRSAWLAAGGSPATRFVVTNCGLANQTIANLLDTPGVPCPFDRMIQAAQQVQASAFAQGLTYQIGGVIFTHGETDIAQRTSYAAYLAGLQQLQQDFLTSVVQATAGQPQGVVVPWFCGQPNQRASPINTVDVAQAMLDWSNTPNSDFYVAAPKYMHQDPYIPHLTANGYRWHGNQIGKAMACVLIAGAPFAPLQMAAATASGQVVTITFSGAVGGLQRGDAYSGYTKIDYPDLGFSITDQTGDVPLATAALSATALTLGLRRPLSGAAVCQAGYRQNQAYNLGTNVCDSDATVADKAYIYLSGVQNPSEDITSWNGRPLIGRPYPLQNYCAAGTVPIT